MMSRSRNRAKSDGIRAFGQLAGAKKIAGLKGSWEHEMAAHTY